MQTTYQLKGAFFDRAGIARKVAAGKRRALSLAGAWIRRRARSLLRKRKAPSNPGSPPSIHTAQEPNLRTILFIYDDGPGTVVVGPVKLNKVNQSWIDARSRPLPQILEFGDVLEIHEEATKSHPDQWRRRDLRRLPKPWKLYRKRRATYRPRPFMAPALADTLPTLPQSCKDFLDPSAATPVRQAA